ncbi:MAG: YceI family protein [Bacteroidota bacterium]
MENTENLAWSVDQIHSRIGFSVRHMVVSEAIGHFNSFKVNVSSPKDSFEGSHIEVIIDAKSIDTGMPDRNGHLMSDDFFNVEKFPEIKFVGTTFVKTGEESFKLSGDLTIRDITKKIDLDVVHGGQIVDPYGYVRTGFKVTGNINRLDFDLKWNALLETGSAILGKIVSFSCDIELVRPNN